MVDVAFVLGAVISALVVVHIFLGIAGVRIQTIRQSVAAYIAVLIATLFVSAVGNADGGPPNFFDAPARVIGTLIAFAIEVVGVRARAVENARPKQRQPPPLPPGPRKP